MKKKILLPTDFSKNSWNAIIYAIELFKNEECDFYLLNVFNASGYAMDTMMIPEPGERLYEEEKIRSVEGLKKIAEKLKVRDTSLHHKFFINSQYNNLVEGIKNIIDSKDIEMVIMGTKGETNSESIIYGSNSVLIMEKIRSCPVLAIPENTIYQDPREIVFPTDFMTPFKRRELIHLVEIAKITKASIRVLHISEEKSLSQEQQNNQRLLKEYLEEIPHTFHTLHNIDVQGGVTTFVEARNSDMITFINRKHSFFGSLFSRPMVKNLGHRSRVPVLALHDQRG